MSQRQNTISPLTNLQLMSMAPSIFAPKPWEGMSEKYTFIPTIDVIEKLRSEGFAPVHAMQSMARIEGKGNFARHEIRFRDIRNGSMEPAIRSLGQIFFELSLVNGHDGSSAFVFDAGLLRLVCLNGMKVGAGTIAAIRARHTGKVDGIIDAAFEVVEQFPKVLDSVERFSQLKLEAPQQAAYAEAALMLKYDEGSAPVTPAMILQPERAEDAEPTLWNTFNTVQEHLIGGGIKTKSASGRKMTTRGVKSIPENNRINKALWTLTEKMRDLLA